MDRRAPINPIVKRIPSVEECMRRWVEGMLRTPPVPCPNCGRRTRARWYCQWCRKVWTKEELEIRREMGYYG